MYAKKFCGTDFSIRGNELFWDHKSSKYCLIRWINGNQNLKLKTKISTLLFTLKKKWYFVTKIVLTYCEKKLF